MIMGTTRIIATILTICQKCKLTDSKIPADGAYIPAQNVMFNGVMNTAHRLAMAVMETDKATLPLAVAVMKLEMLPPGQAATSIIPRATLAMG